VGSLNDVALSVEPIAGHPALIAGTDNPSVVIADLHVGLGDDFENRGVYTGRQIGMMLAEIIGLSSYGNHLIILGDLRHEFSAVNSRSAIPEFMSKLLEYYSKIELVPGNHDGLIVRQLPQRVIVHPPGGFTSGDIAFTHGHTWPEEEMMKGKILLMGHIHPAIEFVDSLGNSYIEKCWLRAPFRKRDPTSTYSRLPEEVVVVPAFNPFLTGSPVNRDPGGLGPLFRNRLIEVRKSRLYLLDGTFLGRLATNVIRGARKTGKNN
jgi:putative SbcD/Mre11-related phosphoesterase